MVSVYVVIAKTRINEGSQVLATANVRSGSAASVPTTLEWRLYNKTHDLLLADWQTLSPGSSVEFSISALYHKIWDVNNTENFEVAVIADRGLSTQAVGKATYIIINVGGVSPGDIEKYLLDESGEAILDESGELIYG